MEKECNIDQNSSPLVLHFYQVSKKTHRPRDVALIRAITKVWLWGKCQIRPMKEKPWKTLCTVCRRVHCVKSPNCRGVQMLQADRWPYNYNPLLTACNHSFIASVDLSSCKGTRVSIFVGTKIIPVVPHKAVAEVSKIGNRKPIGEVSCCESRMAERIHWWTERWLDLCFLEWLQWLQWSPPPQLLDVVWCSAVVVVK